MVISHQPTAISHQHEKSAAFLFPWLKAEG
jgi:hypothetical protein